MGLENKGLAFFEGELPSIELFRAILDTVQDEIVIVSPDCHVVFANARAAERMGATDPALMELTCHNMHYRCDFSDEIGVNFCPVQEVLKSKSSISSRHTVMDDFGNLIPMRIEATPIFDDGVNVRWIVQVLTEMHEEARLQADEIRRRTVNEKNVKFMSSLNDMVTHDFNNLMSGILSNVDYLMETCSVDSPTQEVLSEISAAASRAVSRLPFRTMNAPRRQSLVIDKEHFSISRINLNNLIEKLRPDIEAWIPEHIVLRFDMDEDLPFIQGDAALITQVVMNLVTNANDAVGESAGVIKLGIGRKFCDAAYVAEAFPSDSLKEGLYAYVEVSDTGVGMDADTMTRIFSPFFTTKRGALGLGLKVVLGVVHNSRGAVEVFSHAGEGSTFRVLFPTVSPEQSVFVSESVPRESAAAVEGAARTVGTVHPKGGGAERLIFAGKKILVVDDEETIRNVAGHMLEFLGFEVVTVESGLEALNILKEHRDFSLVLLDLFMPNMAGEECFRAIKELDGNTRIVMSSGFCKQDVIGRFQDKGPVGYIQKPYRLDELRTVLKEAFHL